MAGRRIVADLICYNAAISACEKGLSWPSAIELLQEISSTRRCPTSSCNRFSGSIKRFEPTTCPFQATAGCLQLQRHHQRSQLPLATCAGALCTG